MVYSQNSDDGSSRIQILKWILIAVVALALIIILIIGISYLSTRGKSANNLPNTYQNPVIPGESSNYTPSAPTNGSSVVPYSDNLTGFDFGNSSAADVRPIILGNKNAADIPSNVNNGSASNLPAFNPNSGDATAVPGFNYNNGSAADVPSNIK